MSLVTKCPAIVPERQLGRSGAQRGPDRPGNRRDARQRPFRYDRIAAGRLAPISALFVDHDGLASLNPHALNWEQFDSVSGHLVAGDMV